MSNVSTCDGPPNWCRKMTCLAFAGGFAPGDSAARSRVGRFSPAKPAEPTSRGSAREAGGHDSRDKHQTWPYPSRADSPDCIGDGLITCHVTGGGWPFHSELKRHSAWSSEPLNASAGIPCCSASPSRHPPRPCGGPWPRATWASRPRAPVGRFAAERRQVDLVQRSPRRKPGLHQPADPVVVGFELARIASPLMSWNAWASVVDFRTLALAGEQSVGLAEGLEEPTPHPRPGQLRGANRRGGVVENVRAIARAWPMASSRTSAGSSRTERVREIRPRRRRWSRSGSTRAGRSATS